MVDREKVIKALEVCSSISDGEACPKECPYRGQDIYCSGSAGLMLHALDLLKEQEAVEPEVYCVGQDKYKFYRCPACKTAWYYKGNYCLGCGRAVKWE